MLGERQGIGGDAHEVGQALGDARHEGADLGQEIAGVTVVDHDSRQVFPQQAQQGEAVLAAAEE